MAQGAVEAAGNGTTVLTAGELHEIRECEKIVRFRDAVLAGVHPWIKPPPHMVGKQVATARNNVSSTSVLAPRPNPPSAQSDAVPATAGAGAYAEDNPSLYNHRPNLNGAAGNTSVGMSKLNGPKSEINPILLEKSDDLIKAEIQLQRQRLERGLQKQVEQRKLSQKAALQSSESLPDFDLSEVLSRALTIVHPTTAAEAEQSVGARTSASDSFDENTFYSSQHDTPEQSISSQARTEPGEAQLQGPSLSKSQSLDVSAGNSLNESRDVVMSGLSFSHDVVPGLTELPPKRLQNQPPISQHTSKPTDNTTDVSRQNQPVVTSTSSAASTLKITSEVATEKAHPTSSIMDESSGKPLQQMQTLALQSVVRDTLKRKLSAQEEPLVRAFELSLVAPQPARVSPLATARAPPIVEQSQILSLESARPLDEGTSPQVAALRTAGSSPDSSPKGSKSSEKRKKKKKNGRKSSLGAKSGAVDTPDSIYIKPEPRSPSPFGTGPLPRPHKRQRQTLQQVQELNYDEPRYDTPGEKPQELREQQSRSRISLPSPQYVPQYRGAREQPKAHDEDRLYEPREVETVRRAGGEEQYRRVVSHETYRAPRSPPVWMPYSPRDRPVRAASHVVVERPPQEQAHYYRETQPLPSGVFRVDADDVRPRSPRRSPILMAPPRHAPSRIVMDEFGRQYYTPAPVPVASRQAVASLARPVEDDYIYERAPMRAVTRAPADLYEADGVVYRRASPQFAPRRVVTVQDHETYRQREYSARPLPMAPQAEEYVRVVEPERRQVSHFDEMPREYHPRVGTVRPEAVRYEAPREYVARGQTVRPEALRHEMPSEYITRGQSVRPDVTGRERASARPEPRREAPTQTIREFSVRPSESELVRREYFAPQERAYAPARPVARRLDDEVEYIERPREVPKVYGDDSREVVYR